MTFKRLSRIGFVMVFLLGVSLALLDSLSVDIADGSEDKDGDARREKSPLVRDFVPRPRLRARLLP